MKRKHLFPALLVIVLILIASAGAAYAYFTTYANALGGYEIHLKYETVIRESVEGTTKSIQIANNPAQGEDPGQYPVFVRVKVFNGTDSTTEFQGDTRWAETVVSPNYKIYTYPYELYTGESTSILKIKVNPVETAKVQPGDPVDVTVTYESVPAVFQPGGAPDLATAWSYGENTVLIG